MTRLQRNKPIYKYGSLIGMIRTDRVYITFRNKDHWFKKYNGFGISFSVLDELKNYDVVLIKIIYTKQDNTQEVYITELNKFFEEGLVYCDNGDFQRILNIKHFKKVGNSAKNNKRKL